MRYSINTVIIYQNIPFADIFYYHTSYECYKKYTHKNYLERIDSKRKRDEVENLKVDEGISDLVVDARKSKRLAKEFSVDLPSCLLCGFSKTKGVKQLHTLESIEKAEKLFKATRYFKDDVFTKTVLLNDGKSFIDSKLLYHARCLRSYEQKYSV